MLSLGLPGEVALSKATRTWASSRRTGTGRVRTGCSRPHRGPGGRDRGSGWEWGSLTARRDGQTPQRAAGRRGLNVSPKCLHWPDGPLSTGGLRCLGVERGGGAGALRHSTFACHVSLLPRVAQSMD